jgi:hypothetical protein
MPKQNNQSVNFWMFLQNVLIHSMNTGQFPMAIAGLVIIAFIWKIPTQDASKLASDTLRMLADGSLTGYGIAVLLTIGWYAHVRFLKNMITMEIDRMANEKTKYQASAGVPVESSDKP